MTSLDRRCAIAVLLVASGAATAAERKVEYNRDVRPILAENCFACHGAKGEGLVGPNLTDNYWLHGGTINDVFKTIKYGVPEKGMQSWEKMYSPVQIKNLSSYIKSLAGTNPPNAKPPQGDLFQETKIGNVNVKTDSTAVKK